MHISFWSLLPPHFQFMIQIDNISEKRKLNKKNRIFSRPLQLFLILTAVSFSSKLITVILLESNLFELLIDNSEKALRIYWKWRKVLIMPVNVRHCYSFLLYSILLINSRLMSLKFHERGKKQFHWLFLINC